MKKLEKYPLRGLEIGEDVAGRGGGGGRVLARDVRGRGASALDTPNVRARIGGNQPPPEAKLPIERGAKPKASANFKLKAEPRTTAKSALPAPAVHTKGDQSAVEKIYEHAALVKMPRYEMAKEPVFAPANAALTKELVPQTSIADKLPPMPSPDRMPLKGRSMPILENTQAIGRKLANDILAAPNMAEMPFYSTGTVLQGLRDRAGMSPEASNQLLSDWSTQGAATSPRTKTPANLRNASYLLHRQAIGDPLTPSRQQADQDAQLWGLNERTGKPNMNRPGFPMMAEHTQMAEDMTKGTFDPWSNPKPGTFRENWRGNMADVTGDTHNIRAIVDAYDQIAPGTLPRGWFKDQASYDTYVANKGFPKEGPLPIGKTTGIEDSLGGQMVPGTGKYAQTEYPVLTGPTRAAAEMLNLSPAEVQERLWFLKGGRTGLQSPAMTIPDLFNSQIETTAKVLGLTPDAVMKMWAQRRIPFAENAPQNVPGESGVG